MNLGTASGLTISTFPLPSCLNRTSVQSMATLLPNFVLRNHLGWQRPYVSCNQFSDVSNFYCYNVTLNLNHIIHARRQDEEICYCYTILLFLYHCYCYSIVIVIPFSVATKLKLCLRHIFWKILEHMKFKMWRQIYINTCRKKCNTKQSIYYS
jgi:hypothetical protein